MRSVGSELLSVAAVLAIPVGIAAVFPRAAIGFTVSRPSVPAVQRTASIVFLDETTVARAMRMARTVSRSEGDGRSHIDLISPELPGADALPAVSIGLERRPSDPSVIESGIPPFLPSCRAPAPVRISAEPDGDPPPFSRNELLKLN